MTNADNDNEEFSFRTLAAITAGALPPTEKQDERSDDDREAEQRRERAEKAQREYVDQRLRELAAFERRASGK